MPAGHGGALTVFLCGDVMTGRGIDQVFPHPCPPHLHEPYVLDARDYIALAEEVNGPIPRPVGPSYIWGDALAELERRAPDARLINLETSITTREEWWPDKGIHYRMNPAHVACLTAARIGCCALANNHVLDWGYEGLRETLATLRGVGIATAGAGALLEQARAPAVLDVPGKGRVVVFSFGTMSSGIPPEWAAGTDRPGVELLADLTPATARLIGARVRSIKRTGDLVIASIHWGGNWGYQVPLSQREFAWTLIDEAGVDVVHGHSSHHPRGIEVHQDRLILHGCGDFLNDYEGIRGYEDYRGDLTLMYFVTLEPTSGRLLSLRMTPMQVRRFQACRASSADAGWLQGVLDREGRHFGTRVTLEGDGSLALHWSGGGPPTD
ncbi:CapA family protein [Melittangium boletus]|uniref:Poly-gamma-glutamate biosynthesis protein n=1 Tax=Melittangium boletus DSM 14713 TaxID=1294270 RepID=A0A250I705_9BACT|nr:CapA family protein [Melittangium boletus]ATB27649.1 poly-gamma-glutamate biosynthesis protein [Melittangium boletus DSM 14713]